MTRRHRRDFLLDSGGVSERYADDWGGVQGSMVHAALTEGRVLHAAT